MKTSMKRRKFAWLYVAALVTTVAIAVFIFTQHRATPTTSNITSSNADYSAEWERRAVADTEASADITANIRGYDFSHTLLGSYGAFNPSYPSSFYSYLGIVGPTDQRIDVHIEKITRDPSDKALYHVTGKDRYKGAVASFEGTIVATHLLSYDSVETVDNDPPNLRGGSLVATYSFTETGVSQPAHFKGVVVSKWYIDPKTNTVRYYNLSPADGFQNNVFVGTRVEGGLTEKAIWGDGFFFRPFAADFARGAGDWVVQPPYNTAASGWNWTDFQDPLPQDWWK